MKAGVVLRLIICLFLLGQYQISVARPGISGCFLHGFWESHKHWGLITGFCLQLQEWQRTNIKKWKENRCMVKSQCLNLSYGLRIILFLAGDGLYTTNLIPKWGLLYPIFSHKGTTWSACQLVMIQLWASCLIAFIWRLEDNWLSFFCFLFW